MSGIQVFWTVPKARASGIFPKSRDGPRLLGEFQSPGTVPVFWENPQNPEFLSHVQGLIFLEIIRLKIKPYGVSGSLGQSQRPGKFPGFWDSPKVPGRSQALGFLRLRKINKTPWFWDSWFMEQSESPRLLGQSRVLEQSWASGTFPKSRDCPKFKDVVLAVETSIFSAISPGSFRHRTCSKFDLQYQYSRAVLKIYRLGFINLVSSHVTLDILLNIFRI